MKMKIVVVDFEIPAKAKRWALRLGIPLVILGAAGVAFAAPTLKSWTAGSTLTADDLNANFQAVVTPPGTIAAYAGAIDGNPGDLIDGKPPTHLPPPGWLWCNGASLNGLSPDYAALYQAIGTSFGGISTSQSFNLPDLRGVFLRGANSARKNVGTALLTAPDPDAATRVAAAPGGNPGDAVGSFQLGATAKPAVTAFQSSLSGGHSHTVGWTSDGARVSGNIAAYDPGNVITVHNTPTGYGVGSVSTAADHRHTIESGGDAETRPVNIAVNYIIKY